jgi:hypothetical protein
MSQFIWNGVELEVNMGDIDFTEKYEKAFTKMEKEEERLKKVGLNSEFLRGYFEMFSTLFDDLFGAGTSEKLFEGKRDIQMAEDCYDAFIDTAKKDVAEINKRRAKKIAKYAVKSRK